MTNMILRRMTLFAGVLSLAVSAQPVLADNDDHDRGHRGKLATCKVLMASVDTADKMLTVTGEFTTRRGPPRVWFGGDPVEVLEVATETEIVFDLAPFLTDLTGPKDFLLEIRLRRKDCPSHMVTVVPAGPPEDTHKIIFITSASYNGDLVTAANGLDPAPTVPFTSLQGLLAGDFICQNHAALGSLPWAYKAWLSDATDSATNRLDHRTVPYVLPSGNIRVAENFVALTNTLNVDLENAIRQDEIGIDMGEELVWTGTDPEGVPSAAACGSWTGPVSSVGDTGRTGDVSSDWTAFTLLPCTEPAHIYCVQQ